jgi:hypothetical protein
LALLNNGGDLTEGFKVDDVGHGAHGVVGQQFVSRRKGLRMTPLSCSGFGGGNGLLCIQTCSRVCELS